MTRDSFWRPPDWKNTYLRDITDEGTVAWEAYESGASAMGEHILSLLKEKARASVIIDILEMREKTIKVKCFTRICQNIIEVQPHPSGWELCPDCEKLITDAVKRCSEPRVIRKQND